MLELQDAVGINNFSGAFVCLCVSVLVAVHVLGGCLESAGVQTMFQSQERQFYLPETMFWSIQH